MKERNQQPTFVEARTSFLNQLEVAGKEATPMWTAACDRADKLAAQEAYECAQKRLADVEEDRNFQMVLVDVAAARMEKTLVDQRIKEHQATIVGYGVGDAAVDHHLSSLAQSADKPSDINLDNLLVQVVSSTKGKIRNQ